MSYEKLSKEGASTVSRVMSGELLTHKWKMAILFTLKNVSCFLLDITYVKLSGGYMDPFINMGDEASSYKRAKAGKHPRLNEKITMLIRKKYS